MRSDAELIGNIDFVKPLVKRLFHARDGDLELGAVIVFAFSFVGGQGLLVLDREAGGLGLALGQLLELGLDVLVIGWLRLVFGEPLHLVGDLVAACA